MEWINVKDRLPEEGQRVTVKFKPDDGNEFEGIGTFLNNKFCSICCFTDRNDLNHEVVEWKPLEWSKTLLLAPEKGEMMNNWVSVKEKLPPDYEYVLIYAQMKGCGEPCPISIGRYACDEWECFKEAVACGDLTWEIDSEDITHWRPIPKPPEKK